MPQGFGLSARWRQRIMPGSHLTPTPLDDALLEALGEAARDVVRVDVRAGDVVMVDIRAFHQWRVLERGRREDHPDAWRIWLGMSRWPIHGGFARESALNHPGWRRWGGDLLSGRAFQGLWNRDSFAGFASWDESSH